MSHNVSIEGVNISDLDVLEQAIKELKSEGVNMSLNRSGGKFRGDYSNETADAIIEMHDCRYDIGLIKQADGTYQPRMESGAYDVREKLGVERGSVTNEGAACDMYGPKATIGRLVQRINVITAENEAARSGYTTTREHSKDGIMQVVAVGI